MSASSGIGSTANPIAGSSSSAAAATAVEDTTDVNREIAILKKLDHPNVVKLFEVSSQHQQLHCSHTGRGHRTHNAPCAKHLQQLSLAALYACCLNVQLNP